MISADRERLDVLYPGEQFDLSCLQVIGDPLEAEFTVAWTDGNGRHETTRLLNI